MAWGGMDMTKKKAAPGLENRNETREPHRFPKGVSGNPGGRPKKNPEVKEFCKNQSLEMAQNLYNIARDESTKISDVIAIARLFLEYGIGKPANEYDSERLSIERKRLELEQKRTEAATTSGASAVNIEWDGAEELSR
jgi:hypothetical protein